MIKERMSKASMTADERRLRSRLNQLISGAGLIRGTLTSRKITCGKKGCKCAKGEKHEGLYLVASESGRIRQLYISSSREAAARLWLKQYRQAHNLLEDVVQKHWKKLRDK